MVGGVNACTDCPLGWTSPGGMVTKWCACLNMQLALGMHLYCMASPELQDQTSSFGTLYSLN